MKDVNAKKLELNQITSRIYAGKEKNIKKAKMLRREIARMLTKLSKEGETK